MVAIANLNAIELCCESHV